MADDDWEEIFHHMRRRVREVGLADLDDRLTVDFEGTGDARRDFLSYLSRLTGAVSERSYSGYAKALTTLREALSAEGDQGVEGIEVFVSETDSQVFGTSRVDLGRVEDLTPLIHELGSLRQYLRKKGLIDE